MAQSDFFIDGDDIHPIDIVESWASHNDWDFDRLADDQIAMIVEGQWRHYSVTLAWCARDQVLRLICTYDLDPPQDSMAVFFESLNLVNDQVWDGGFTYWAEQKLMVWRYGLVLSGEVLASPEQIDQMIRNAVSASERFYPCFQLACWGGAAPEDALDIAISEAYGRA